LRDNYFPFSIAIFRGMKNYENGKKVKNVQPKVVPNNQYFWAFE